MSNIITTLFANIGGLFFISLGITRINIALSMTGIIAGLLMVFAGFVLIPFTRSLSQKFLGHNIAQKKSSYYLWLDQLY
jgi:hypothetical protein